MTPITLNALAAIALRIHADLAALGPQPLNESYTLLDRQIAIVRIGVQLEAVPGIVPANDVQSGQLYTSVSTKYDEDGDLLSASVYLLRRTPDKDYDDILISIPVDLNYTAAK